MEREFLSLQKKADETLETVKRIEQTTIKHIEVTNSMNGVITKLERTLEDIAVSSKISAESSQKMAEAVTNVLDAENGLISLVAGKKQIPMISHIITVLVLGITIVSLIAFMTKTKIEVPNFGTISHQ